MTLPSNKITSFTFLHQNQPDRPNTVFASSAAFKAAIDTQAQQSQTAINGTIDNLVSVTPGNSGSENIGAAPVAGVTGATVSAQITSLSNSVQNIMLTPTSYSMSRQAVINGNFDVWQRGTSIVLPADIIRYGADRWKGFFQTDGAAIGTVTDSRNAVYADGIGNSFFSNRTTFSASITPNANTQHFISQPIEYGTRYLCGVGQKVTLTFWARSSISGKKLGLTAIQNYGTGGAPSTAEILTGTVITLTSTFQKYSFTFTTNTLTGKDFGSNLDDYLEVRFQYAWGTAFLSRFNTSTIEGVSSSGTVDIAQIQINAGDQSIPFQPKSFEQELQDCLRYYEKSYDYINPPGTATSNGYNLIGVASNADNATTNVSFNVRKRVVPTITLYHSSGTSAAVGKTISNTSVTSVTQVVKGETGLGQINKTGGFTTGDVVMAHWSSDAEI